MYYPEYSGKAGPFGLRCGQMRHRKVRAAKNAGWYNRRGEKLGWGDLSHEDLDLIRRGLPADEAFIILCENDASLRFIMGKKRRKERAPGVRYVIEKCMYIVAGGRLYLVDRFASIKEKYYRRRGLRFKIISGETAAALIKGVRSS
jgi:hypothetical protein